MPAYTKEYPNFTVFELYPGAIGMQMAEEASVGFPDDLDLDSPRLPAATMLYLTSGQRDWMNGNFCGHLGYRRN
ncbi:hypothetical protein H4582DRAFT_1895522 [Lactarius indigo]|nr:hypothetical protein H4582DRAFT_2040142 [Lactarius indigo]KAI9447673.1 hypothetical protein H4582DRAFT_1895522 [Lactarius indigo]